MLPPSPGLNSTENWDDRQACEPAGERWSWVFWLLLAAAAAPLCASIVSVQTVLGNDDLLTSYNGGYNPDLEFADRWGLVLAVTVLDRPMVASMLALLAVAAVVVSGRPQWSAPASGASGRWAVGILATASGLWAAATATFTLFVVLGPPTARQAREESGGGVRASLRDVGDDVAVAALVVVVAVVVVLALWRLRPSDPRIVEDPAEGAQAE